MVQTVGFYQSVIFIASGVNHSPWSWCAGRNGLKPIFSYLNKKYLEHLRSGRALLMLDQSLEGHQTHWLWSYLHKECDDYGVNPKSLVYVTGNQLAVEQYTLWADAQAITDRLKVIVFPIFEQDVWYMAKDLGIKNTIEDNIKYKQTHDIKVYNCLQKRLRAHRLWFYTTLQQHDLLKDGLVSQNPFEQRNTYLDSKFLEQDVVDRANATLPSLVYGQGNVEQGDGYYIRRILKDVYFDSWISVVSEVAYGEQDHSVFLSEKTFKAIVCGHPFILLSARGSLAKLRAMGYKTFHGWIDESYDDLPTFERMEAIAEELERIRDIPNKQEWYASMRPVLEYNYLLLKHRATNKLDAITELENYYDDTI